MFMKQTYVNASGGIPLEFQEVRQKLIRNSSGDLGISNFIRHSSDAHQALARRSSDAHEGFHEKPKTPKALLQCP